VVKYLEDQLPQNATLIVVYCDHKEYQSQNLKYFLGAMIRMAVHRQNIPDDVSKLYLKHHDKGTNSSEREYTDLLQSVTKGRSMVYVVIDALDECVDKNGRPIWVQLIRTLKIPFLTYACYTPQDRLKTSLAS
jgi:hypothetical protein